MQEMNKLLKSLAFCILLCAGQALSADLSAPYPPTRAEWLRVYLAENIKTTTDGWPLRLRVMVTVVSNNQQVLVTLKPADGEKKPSKEQRDFMISSVTEIVTRALGSYAWSKDLKVTVSFV
jgi:hypothetical protein